jgi:hypothetical protein
MQGSKKSATVEVFSVCRCYRRAIFVPASPLCRPGPSSMACPHIQPLNVQLLAYTENGCGSIALARELRGFLVEGSFMSGCDDTASWHGNLAGLPSPTDVCVCGHSRGIVPSVGHKRHLSQFRKSTQPFSRGRNADASSLGGRPAEKPCRCGTTPRLIARVMLALSRRGHRRRVPGTSRVRVP